MPRRLTRLLTLLALLAVAALPTSSSVAAPGPARVDDEIVREFKKYFRKYKDTPTRVEAVLALEGTESPAVVEVLAPVLKKAEPEVTDAIVRVLGGFTTPGPVAALLAELDGERNDEVRLGLLRAVVRAGYPEAADMLVELLADGAWEVRRRAAQALFATGDARAVEATLPLAGDKEPAVRCAVLDGLAAAGAREVLVPARAALADESWQVRASAIAALGAVRDKDSIPLLIDRLEAEEGRLKEDLARALDDITTRNFGQRVELWRRFWERLPGDYAIPTAEELAKLRARQAENAARYVPPDATSYHGIDTPSRSIVFVIDVSGSMEQLTMEPERFKDGGYPSMQRLDIVKTELRRTIERLEPYVRFNVLSFATDVDPWKKDLVPANVLNKSSADTWIARLEPIGGASKEDLAEVGLTSAANLEGGKTNTYGALMAALGVETDAQGRKGDDYELELDTVFFLSDGRPSHGAYVVPEDILREVREVNELRKVVIHTIGIGDVDVQLMERLAAQNGGRFVDLGR